MSHVKGDADQQPGHAGGHSAVGFGNGLVDELRQGGGLLLVEFLAQDLLQEAADGLGHAQALDSCKVLELQDYGLIHPGGDLV